MFANSGPSEGPPRPKGVGDELYQEPESIFDKSCTKCEQFMRQCKLYQFLLSDCVTRHALLKDAPQRTRFPERQQEQMHTYERQQIPEEPPIDNQAPCHQQKVGLLKCLYKQGWRPKTIEDRQAMQKMMYVDESLPATSPNKSTMRIFNNPNYSSGVSFEAETPLPQSFPSNPLQDPEIAKNPKKLREAYAKAIQKERDDIIRSYTRNPQPDTVQSPSYRPYMDRDKLPPRPTTQQPKKEAENQK